MNTLADLEIEVHSLPALRRSAQTGRGHFIHSIELRSLVRILRRNLYTLS